MRPGGRVAHLGRADGPGVLRRAALSTLQAEAPKEGPRAAARDAVLVDTFGRRHTYLRISVTERCRQEIERLARLFVAHGVSKLRLTGGEPLVRPDVEDVAARLGRLRPLGLRTLAITTNGIALARKLPALRAAGLTHVNVSLDTLRPDRFEQITRRRGHERVLEAIDAALDHGFAPVKVNTVVMRGVNDDELGDLVRLTETKPIQLRFIELMPFDENGWRPDRVVPYAEMLALVRRHYPQLAPAPRAGPDETAKLWRVPGFRGELGFISSMTDHFCASCSRARLTADGKLKMCLFGAAEVCLREPLRRGASDEELAQVVAAAVRAKAFAHGGRSGPAELAAGAQANRPMIKIGG